MDVLERPARVRYGAAVAAVVAAVAVRLALSPLLGDSAPYLFLWPAILFVAWFAGFRASLVAMALGIAASSFVFFLPGFERAAEDETILLRLALFFPLSAFACVLIEQMHRARRRARASVEEASAQRERLTLAMDAAQMGWWHWDASDDRVHWSGQLDDLFGFSPAEVGGTYEGVLNRVHPDDRDRVRATVDEAVKQQRGFETEFRVTRPDGSLRWVLSKGRLFFNAEGHAVHMTGVDMDITERKKSETALSESEARFRQLADAMPQIVWAAGADGRLDYSNRRWSEQFGPIGRLGSTLHPDELIPCLRRWATSVSRGEPFARELRLLGPSGAYRWHLARALPARDEAGQVRRWYGTCTDIDDQKRAEVALREQDRRKDEFIATLAHELRNPLAPIQNAVDLLRESPPTVESVGWARDVIERQTRLLTRLVDDLLDAARVSRGQVELRREPVELGAVIADAVESARPLLESFGHTLTLVPPPAPVFVSGDAVRLGQVFANLLDNSAKYTEPGGQVGLSVRAGNGTVEVRVRDSGVGIPHDVLPRLFEPLTQGARPALCAPGGLGLGLALVQRLVSLHEGVVTAHSDGLGRGSEFIVRLPTVSAPATRPSPPSPPRRDARPGRRVLVVDDNRDAAESLGMLLRLWGHDVRLAYDGPAAVEAARTFRPEVALLDIGLPGMTGHEVARQLRQDLGLKGALLVAMTGYGLEEDRRRSREAGLDIHLVKPVDPSMVKELLTAGCSG